MDTEIRLDHASRMMALFEGFSEAYGTYGKTNPNGVKGGKLEIKATAKTIRSRVTTAVWQNHLDGVSPLGIIPIRDNDTCLWGVIDIDQYGIDHIALLKKIEKEGLPLVVCRSKSGGAHVFLFLLEPAEAALVLERLGEIAALLGYGNAEIFPKQRTVQVDRGDLGSWLNMPYFEGDNSNRYAIKTNGLAMTVGEFLEYAESQRVPLSFMEKEHRKKPKNDPDFGDGPPCMQHLAATGFPEGVRNKGLFALATFAKKKYGENWTSVLERWNYEYFDPPLPASEVMLIVRSHEKKDYNYTCRDQPLSAHCNSGLCRARKYGVGGEDDFPIISGLSVLETDPPLWFLDVGEVRLELTTDELQNYSVFHKVCMERMFKCYRMMKKETWLSVVSTAMNDVVKIEAPQEVGNTGRFIELLEQFVRDKHKALEKEELLLGKPWEDPDTGRIYFRLQDLEKFLESEGFKIYSRAQMVTRVKNLQGETRFFNLKGKGVNTWFVPGAIFKSTPRLNLPPVDRSPI